MRIIAGEFRGRVLLPPQSDTTRPITDRAKQSLFDILAPIIPDTVVYDFFAGTGSMGLECLSRGAKRAVFFEADRSALQRLRKNIDALRVADRAAVIAGDLFRWASGGRPPRFATARSAEIAAGEGDQQTVAPPPPEAQADRSQAAHPQADLIFLDPPYRFLRERADDLRRLALAIAGRHLALDGWVVFRHDSADNLDLPPLVPADTRQYGGMTIDLLRPPVATT